MHLACDRGHAGVAKLLLSRGADTTIKVSHSRSVAVLFGLMEWLAHIQDSDEYTALELAEIAEHDEIVSLVKAASSSV